MDQHRQDDHREDLQADEAVRKIRDIVERAESCFFCTTAAAVGAAGVRPMHVRKVDDEGNLWFLSASDSRKNAEVARDPSVQLFFQGSSHSDFMVLSGRASVATDRARIAELWSPLARTWFTQGRDDPRITAIKVTPSDGHYWDTQHGSAVAGIKMAIGAALRKPMDDSVEGRLRV